MNFTLRIDWGWGDETSFMTVCGEDQLSKILEEDWNDNEVEVGVTELNEKIVSENLTSRHTKNYLISRS